LFRGFVLSVFIRVVPWLRGVCVHPCCSVASWCPCSSVLFRGFVASVFIRVVPRLRVIRVYPCCSVASCYPCSSVLLRGLDAVSIRGHDRGLPRANG